MPATMTLLDEPAATEEPLKVRVNTEDAIETAEHIVVQLRVASGKPVSVMTSMPPDGMVTSGVRAIVMVTPVALLKAPGVLSVIAG